MEVEEKMENTSGKAGGWCDFNSPVLGGRQKGRGVYDSSSHKGDRSYPSVHPAHPRLHLGMAFLTYGTRVFPTSKVILHARATSNREKKWEAGSSGDFLDIDLVSIEVFW